MEPKKDSTDLLLVGKTGNGKSALGNTILQRRSFKSKNSTESVTKSADFDFYDFKGRVIKVVDGPGVGDTDLDPKEAAKLVVDAMSEAMCTSTEGFHAILLVVRYGSRFTKEDVETLDTLKKIFGEKFVSDHAILVLTCGDNFSNDTEDSGQTFEAWCVEQGGVFRELFTSVQKRAVLFDNRTKDDKIITDQLHQLLSLVDTLGARYTTDIYDDAKKTRNSLLIAEKRPTLSEDAIKEAGVITQLLGRVDFKKPAEGIRQLEQLMERADALLENVLEQDQGTNSLSVAKKMVQYTKTTIAEELEAMKSLFDKMKEEEEKEEVIRQAEADNQEATEVKLKALQLEKDLARIREKEEAEQRERQEAANEKRREEEQPTENSEQNEVELREKKHCHESEKQEEQKEAVKISVDQLAIEREKNLQVKVANLQDQYRDVKEETRTNWLKAAPLMFPKLWAKIKGGRKSGRATESKFYA